MHFQSRPFRHRKICDGSILAVSETGDHCFVSEADLGRLIHAPDELEVKVQAELLSKYFISRPGAVGMRRLMQSRIAARHATIESGPTLHIIVPTLQCAHSCKYCQVSRSIDSDGFVMSKSDLDRACDTILQAPSTNLTVEFQGGDPLLRFDLVVQAMERLHSHAGAQGKTIQFVIASTLHQLTAQMCEIIKQYKAVLSTSIDGPAVLHNRNRPIKGRDAYERTVAGLALAREHLGTGVVSALMTTTRESLGYPEQIVDEYVALNLFDISLRPLSPFGFANSRGASLGTTQYEFAQFYERAFERILYWNRKGVLVREGQASVVLNKLLHPVDAGYVDLQAAQGAGKAVLVYNYDGYVYPSDEARMLAETGDTSLRLGRIGLPMADLQSSAPMKILAKTGTSSSHPVCSKCAFGVFCSPDPVMAKAQCGAMDAPVESTDHCGRSIWLFEFLLLRLKSADAFTQSILRHWARPVR